MSDKTLLPCPFCGSKAIQSDSFFFCSNPKCRAVVEFDNKVCAKNYDKAIDYWNARAGSGIQIHKNFGDINITNFTA